jgi:hypothetical protein
MPRTVYDLPPDHPIFSIGPSFVFKNGPLEIAEELRAEQEDDSSEQPPVDSSDTDS